MTANVDAMVRAGVDAYRGGNKVEARTLLERAIELDGYNESAWLWLSAVVETKEEQQTCLENVLIINPDNDRAKQGLKSLGIDPATVIEPAEETVPATEDDTFEDVTFDTTDEVVESTPAFTGADFNNEEDEDLFGDIDFTATDDAFSLDDAVFSEPIVEEEEFEFDEAFDEFSVEPDAYVDDYGSDDDVFGDVFDDGDDLYADIDTLEAFDDAIGDGDYDAGAFDDDPFAPVPDVNDNVLTRAEYFAMIPEEINDQRLPGTDEKVSSVHYVMIGVLGLVNLGALAFVALQFIG